MIEEIRFNGKLIYNKNFSIKKLWEFLDRINYLFIFKPGDEVKLVYDGTRYYAFFGSPSYLFKDTYEMDDEVEFFKILKQYTPFEEGTVYYSERTINKFKENYKKYFGKEISRLETEEDTKNFNVMCQMLGTHTKYFVLPDSTYVNPNLYQFFESLKSEITVLYD